ncbi:unnamed protein product [Trichogramma brassicae]|uniref:Reverse transcriptase domain-containing protein n=1 Tax=Trichogramma brassicae TaxID=86971 RepID=A0A6H5I8L5_9HYME|nr:unnamed protein product [Trichogramma brassicae]
MTRIVNASVDLSYFPVSWKTAAVIPLAKGSSVASPSDTRPISLLSELSKIVERIIHTQLSEYLSQSGLLDPGQHGFRPGHSTTTALLEITERARRAIDRREVSVLVSFDFSKAFDTIDHTILIRKLICSGCSDCVIEWFVSYLSGRSVCVRLEDGTHTEPRAVTSGVPQGSVLAPLLFSIFIADLPTCLLNSRHIIYADDTQIISHGLPANIGDLLRDVTRDANAVCEWATTNGLTCNAAKTKVMLIGSLSFVTSLRPSLPAGLDIGGEIVPFSEEIKTLGVFLSRLLALQRLQNACIRYIYGTIPRTAHVTPYRLALGWLSAEGRREVINCSLASRIIRDASPGYLRSGFRVIGVPTETVEIRQSARRRPPVLYYKAPRTASLDHSFAFSSAIAINKLPFITNILSPPPHFSPFTPPSLYSTRRQSGCGDAGRRALPLSHLN